jgi:hypothetical protein
LAKLTEEQLVERQGKFVEEAAPVRSLWQTIADHFYPERADFTRTFTAGQELADSMVDSNPSLMRRDLGNSFNAMLRDGEWFEMGSSIENPSHDASMWLESRTKAMRRAFMERQSGFTRATRQADHDFAAFGQCVLSVERNRNATGLLVRNWHLKDCTWFEDEAGEVCGLNRQYTPYATNLVKEMGEERVHKKVIEKLKKDPFSPVRCVHMTMPSDLYGDDEMQSKFPYVSVWLDIDNMHVMEAIGMHNKMYVVPRFQTVAGSQYAYSPATVVALPDARTLQAITFTLLEAGERYARPPIIATEKAIRSDVNLSSDGITWVDNEYDEKLGAALRTLPQDRGGFPIGDAIRSEIKETLSSAFYLNKLSLPEAGREMTAYEVSERMKQFRREVLPLFAPIEMEYNGALCEEAFAVMMQGGFMGSPYDIPKELQGQNIEFKFKSPLSQTEEEQKVERFRITSGLLREAAEFDSKAVHNVNFDNAFRDALDGSGVPEMWLNSEEDVQERRILEQEIEQNERAATMLQDQAAQQT